MNETTVSSSFSEFISYNSVLLNSNTMMADFAISANAYTHINYRL